MDVDTLFAVFTALSLLLHILQLVINAGLLSRVKALETQQLHDRLETNLNKRQSLESFISVWQSLQKQNKVCDQIIDVVAELDIKVDRLV